MAVNAHEVYFTRSVVLFAHELSGVLMSSYVCVFMDLTVMLVVVRTYLTMVGFMIRDPHALTLVAASMLMAPCLRNQRQWVNRLLTARAVVSPSR